MTWFIEGLLAGLAIMTGLLRMLFLFRRYRRPAHVDYRERWLQAVGLLGQEGRLTAAEVASITGAQAGPVAVPEKPPARRTASQEAGQSLLRSMASWDRRDLEIGRAVAGLPPADDLAGMATWDVKAVLDARAMCRRGSDAV